MSPLSAASQLWPAFAGLIISLGALAILSRLLSRYLQYCVFYLTGSQNMAMVVYFLLFLPGVFVHEAAHWLVARLCGLRTGRFRVWPQRQGGYIGLGSVQVSSGGVIIDNLVGMAPLLAGSLLITLVGVGVFEAAGLAAALAQGQWMQMVRLLWQTLDRPDGGLWAYLLFTVGNVMMPSASDRHQLAPLLLYLALAGGIYLLLGLPGAWLAQALAGLSLPLQTLTSALLLVLLLDGVVVIVLFGLAQVLARLTR